MVTGQVDCHGTRLVEIRVVMSLPQELNPQRSKLTLIFLGRKNQHRTIVCMKQGGQEIVKILSKLFLSK